MITYLNTFAGLGGNTEKLDRSKFNITHVENDKKRLDYLEDTFKQDIVIKADAYQFILDHMNDYDILWSSPPCTSHSAVRHGNKNKAGYKRVYPDMKLWGLIILLERECNKLYVVENVKPYYKPIIEPNAIVGNHIIYSNKFIPNKKFPPKYANAKPDKERGLTIKDMRDKMNADAGKYIIDCILKQEYTTLEAFA